MKKIICICICISLTAGCGKQTQTKPLPQPEQQMAVKKEDVPVDIAPMKEASETLEETKSYLSRAYGYTKERWLPITVIIVSAVLCAVGYHYDVHGMAWRNVKCYGGLGWEKTKKGWDWIKNKFTGETEKKKAPPTEEKKDEFQKSDPNPPKGEEEDKTDKSKKPKKGKVSIPNPPKIIKPKEDIEIGGEKEEEEIPIDMFATTKLFETHREEPKAPKKQRGFTQHCREYDRDITVILHTDNHVEGELPVFQTDENTILDLRHSIPKPRKPIITKSDIRSKPYVPPSRKGIEIVSKIVPPPVPEKKSTTAVKKFPPPKTPKT